MTLFLLISAIILIACVIGSKLSTWRTYTCIFHWSWYALWF